MLISLGTSGSTDKKFKYIFQTRSSLEILLRSGSGCPGSISPMAALCSCVFSFKTLRLKEFYQHCYVNTLFSIKYLVCLYLASSEFYSEFYYYLHFDFVNVVCD